MTATEWTEVLPGIYRHESSMDQPTIPDAEVKVPCEVYSRVVGYLRPVQAWNEGKREEFEDRVPFKLRGDGDGRQADLDQ